LKQFHALLMNLREYLDSPPDEVIRQVINRSGYGAMLGQSNDQDDLDRLANIEELITAAKEFAAEDAARNIGDFLEQITLASDVDGWNDQQDCVSVMTLHSSKGLEFPVVYILAIEQGLLPHERSLPNEEELEEERRLCFVGMTRAKEELYLCHARLREFRGQSLYAVPSMFLDEIAAEVVERVDLCHRMTPSPYSPRVRTYHAADEELPPVRNGDGRMSVGVIVDHAMYGRGQILELSGAGPLRRVRIRFAHHGMKVFVADKVKLTVVDDE
jgi:DNA helicase-2/ATP-dependent DNA helicase PcrA